MSCKKGRPKGSYTFHYDNIKWYNDVCGVCCIEHCSMLDCGDSCVENDVTCNQCFHSSNTDEED